MGHAWDCSLLTFSEWGSGNSILLVHGESLGWVQPPLALGLVKLLLYLAQLPLLLVGQLLQAGHLLQHTTCYNLHPGVQAYNHVHFTFIFNK